MKNPLLNLKKFAVSFIIAIVFLTGAAAQINTIESFDGTAFLPSGWTAAGNINDWSRRTTGTNPTCLPHSGAAMARFNRMAPPNSLETIVSPVVDYSNVGTDTARVSFWIFRDDGAPTVFDYITLYVNTTQSLSGANYLGSVARSRLINIPDTQSTNNWYQYVYDIPATFNTNTNYLLIRAANDATMGNSIYIDDVEWNSFPAPCTGTPTPGTIISTATTICGGSGSADLTLNGQSTDAGVTYQWQYASSATGPWSNWGASAPTISTGTIYATTYFQCLVTCSNSLQYDSTAVLTISVSPNPAPVVTVTPNFGATYCLGGNPAQLVALGATTYLWTPATGLNVTNADTVLASPTVNTQYTVVGSDSFGCTGFATIGVQSRPALNVNMNSNPNNPCAGEPVVLNANIGGPGFGTVYTWNPGNLVGGNVTVNPTANTVYTVAVSAYNGGCTAIDSINITVTPGPIAGFTYSVNGGTVTFTNTSANASGYEWQYGDGNISFQTSPVYTYSLNGTYNVMLIANNGNCAPDTVIIPITIVINAINSINGSEGLFISSNPTNNTVLLQFVAISSKADLKIINSIGQIVIDRIITPSGNGLYNELIDLSELRSGIYTLHINAADKIWSSKLIKQ